MPGRKLIIIITIIACIWLFAIEGQAGDIADGKIKNGQLLIEKALTASGEQKADYVYKAKREFERGSLAEPENPWPLYWNSVLSYYFEQDSANAGKLYRKAMAYDQQALAEYPPPWFYKNDAHLKSALKGDFKWTKTTRPIDVETPIGQVETTKVEMPVASVPLKSLNYMIENQNFAVAESLYQALLSQPDNDTSVTLRLMGLELKINQDSMTQCADLLEFILSGTKKGSIPAKNATALYDKSLDTILAEAKILESKSLYTDAKFQLDNLQPFRIIRQSAARGKLFLQYASVLLALNDLSGADSALKGYLTAGYKKNAAYNNVKDRLLLVRDQEKKKAELPVAQLEIEAKPSIQPKIEQYISVYPPQGNIINVVVNSIDPATGQIENTKLWETTAPLKLKTGFAYKLTIQRKHERKAPLFIAAAGIIATFFLVR